jgi:hypothetical protein
LAARIIETKNNFFSYHTNLNHQLQQALESSTTPWPYSLINYIPSWVRATFTIIFVTLFIGVFARPLYSLLLCIKNDSIGAVDLAHSVCCGHAATLRAHLRSNRAHLELADRLDAATGVGEHNHLAMAPLIDDSRLQAKVTALQVQVVDLRALIGDNYQSLRGLQDARTSIIQQNLTEIRQNSGAKIQALEEALKKQTSQSKALEVRLNKLELAQPPPYAMSALSKPAKKK